ncbi:astacin-like metalloprotease toxin 1 [Caerostris extrusa]|uniref:Metalloendopeptidase n=1 Tax=Caerostris extrusa TaxID=172846 RepID=A0AAV4XJL8_CAEEX|nr:astacin-like metalloprotease toxin 1 [Caerostris extrusa]
MDLFCLQIYYRCWSVIGCNGGRQLLSLGQGCGYLGLVFYEFGHALCLFHEHQRSDRDNYITVYKQNVIPDQLHNFQLTPAWQEAYRFQYDYNSIMHYGNYAFSKNPRGLKTMEAHNGQALIEPWQKQSFDQLDIIRLNKLYECRPFARLTGLGKLAYDSSINPGEG